MTNPSSILKSLEGSAITLSNHIAYHGAVLKVEFTAIRGKMFTYYERQAGEYWVECSKDRAIDILDRY